MPSKNYPILRDYVRGVATDLIKRGRIRSQRGQSIDTIIHDEARTVIADVVGDLWVLAEELGIGGAVLLEVFARRKIDDALQMGKDVLYDVLAGGKR